MAKRINPDDINLSFHKNRLINSLKTMIDSLNRADKEGWTKSIDDRSHNFYQQALSDWDLVRGHCRILRQQVKYKFRL